MRAARHPAARLLSLVRAGPRAHGLVAEAALALLVARLQLAVRPFTRIADGLGTFVPPDDPRVGARLTAMTGDEAAQARRIGWAVCATAPFMPFRAVCLHQAIAAHAMLRRRRIASVVHFGLGLREPWRQGHAWLDAAGVRVTGYPLDPDLRELGCLI